MLRLTRTENPRVGGSIPPLGTKIRHSLDLPQAFAALAFANGETMA